MLKISSRGHYGLRLMTELARSHGSGPLSLTEVARVESLPLPYLEQLVVPLRRAGLVEGTRGLHGGYRLAVAPESLTVGAVLRVLEGPVVLVDCTASDYVSGACEREPFCSSRGLWGRVKAAVDSVLESTTLSDLIHDPAFALPHEPHLPHGLEPLPLLSDLPQATLSS